MSRVNRLKIAWSSVLRFSGEILSEGAKFKARYKIAPMPSVKITAKKAYVKANSKVCELKNP